MVLCSPHSLCNDSLKLNLLLFSKTSHKQGPGLQGAQMPYVPKWTLPSLKLCLLCPATWINGEWAKPAGSLRLDPLAALKSLPIMPPAHVNPQEKNGGFPRQTLPVSSLRTVNTPSSMIRRLVLTPSIVSLPPHSNYTWLEHTHFHFHISIVSTYVILVAKSFLSVPTGKLSYLSGPNSNLTTSVTLGRADCCLLCAPAALNTHPYDNHRILLWGNSTNFKTSVLLSPQ